MHPQLRQQDLFALSGLAIALFPIALSPIAPALAQPNNVHATASLTPISFARPSLPTPTRPKTGTGRSGAGRTGDDCVRSRSLVPLMALAPNYTNPTLPKFWAQTAQEQPTLWFYLPYQLRPKTEVELVLRDRTNQKIAQTRIIPTQPGVIGIPLSASTARLQLNQDYLWSLSILCRPKDAAANPTITGAISRRNLQPRLAMPTGSRDAAQTYAQLGLWQEAISLVAELRRTQPGDRQIAADWRTLLQETGLKASDLDVVVAQSITHSTPTQLLTQSMVQK